MGDPIDSGYPLTQALKLWWEAHVSREDQLRAGGAAHAIGVSVVILGISSWIKSVHERKQEALHKSNQLKVTADDFFRYIAY